MVIGAGVAIVAAAGGFTWFSVAGPAPRSSAVPAPPAPAGPGSGTSSEAGGGAGAAALSAVAAIPEGGGVVLPDKSLVLVRDTGDSVRAFSAVCTHEGCLVSEVSGGKILCPCHGSAFDVATGQVVQGPAEDPLPAVPVRVADGSVFGG